MLTIMVIIILLLIKFNTFGFVDKFCNKVTQESIFVVYDPEDLLLTDIHMFSKSWNEAQSLN